MRNEREKTGVSCSSTCFNDNDLEGKEIRYSVKHWKEKSVNQKSLVAVCPPNKPPKYWWHSDRDAPKTKRIVRARKVQSAGTKKRWEWASGRHKKGGKGVISVRYRERALRAGLRKPASISRGRRARSHVYMYTLVTLSLSRRRRVAPLQPWAYSTHERARSARLAAPRHRHYALCVCVCVASRAWEREREPETKANGRR